MIHKCEYCGCSDDTVFVFGMWLCRDVVDCDTRYIERLKAEGAAKWIIKRAVSYSKETYHAKE